MNSLRVALESAKANRLPMLVLWSLAILTVAGYFLVPGISGLLEPLARWQRSHGSLAAFTSLFVFCGLIPGAFLLSIRSLRPHCPIRTMFLQSLWFGLWGIVNNGFYVLQGHWFGHGTDLRTLALKTIVDQFVWTPFFLAPLNAMFFFWLARGLSLRRMADEWPHRFVRVVFLPNLIANWIVWIPVLCIVYAFPLPLQIQLAGIASSLWALMCLQVGRRSHEENTV